MLAGFSHVYICDDNSDDNSTMLTELYKSKKKEYMQIVPAPVPNGQHACFAKCKEATLAFTDWWFVAVRHIFNF